MPDAPSPLPRLSGTDLLRGAVGGMLMGLANLVPGISGGTMLLASGVYREFVEAIAELTTLRFRLSSVVLLGTIVGTAIVAIVLLAGPVSQLVVHHRWVMYSLFIGLTLGGVPLLLAMLKPVDAKIILPALAGIGVMTVMVLLTPGDGGAAAGEHPYGLLFLAGIAGASAMVLPGVSGGYLLLVLGQYVAVLSGVALFKDGLSARDWPTIVESMHVVIPVGLGVVVGVVGVSNLIRWLLHHFERPTLGVLLGLLLGAVIGLWPFQAGVAPDVGGRFRGDVVAERADGALVMRSTDKAIEPADYPTAFFAPGAGQIAGALGLIAVGFGASLMVARFGAGRETSKERGAEA